MDVRYSGERRKKTKQIKEHIIPLSSDIGTYFYVSGILRIDPISTERTLSFAMKQLVGSYIQ